MLTVHALLVDARPLGARVSEDRNDEMFLAAALAADARLIVSGDKHLLRVSGWRGIEVLKARPFVDRKSNRQTSNGALLLVARAGARQASAVLAHVARPAVFC